MLRVDERRLASGGDDGTVQLWDHATGARLHALAGHSRPVTCLLLLDRGVLLSGSSDKAIRVWDLRSGACAQVLERHAGSVRCLAKMLPPSSSNRSQLHQQQHQQQPRFCSGANDRSIHVWRLEAGKTQVELVGTIERSEEENLNCMLALNSKYIVTGSSSSSIIYVYSVETMKFHRILSYHRDSPQCLMQVSDTQFVSGSLDGMVVVWHAETLVPLRVLNSPEQFLNQQEHTFPFRVRYLLPLSEQFLAAAIGNGFEVYDVLTGDLVLQCEKAHDGPVTCIIALYNGTRLITASEDSSIKIWAVPKHLRLLPDPRAGSRTLGSATTATTTTSRRGRGGGGSSLSSTLGPFSGGGAKPELIGEMLGHSNSVIGLVPLTESSFASCSADSFVVLWKDGSQQAELRNNYATFSLLQQRGRGGRISPLSAIHGELQRPQQAQGRQLRASSAEDDPEFPPLSVETPASKVHGVTIPVDSASSGTASEGSAVVSGSLQQAPIAKHVMEYVEMLSQEQKLSPQQIADELRNSGHNPAVVAAVLQQLRAQEAAGEPSSASGSPASASDLQHGGRRGGNWLRNWLF